jgi:hypothetical protein
MLAAIHTTIRSLLYERGRLDPAEVEVRFERPAKQWIDSLLQPTINLFLYDIAENTERRDSTMQTTRANGRATMRMPPRRFDLRYMVCGLATVAEDEHLLLWRTLATLLRYNPLPPELLAPELRTADVPLSTTVGQVENGPKTLELWGALDLPPRPALLYSVTAPLDLELAFEAPLVLTRTTRFTRPSLEDEAAGLPFAASRALLDRAPVRIGGVVRSSNGLAVQHAQIAIEGSAAEEVIADEAGRFSLNIHAPGTVTLRVSHQAASPRLVTITVPSSSYDIVLD